MYRGSSFLLKKDYKVHTEVVKEILKKEYDVLCGITCADLSTDDNLKCLTRLSNFIKSHYKAVRKTVSQTKRALSDTLVTKVLMGTLGCVPAYDSYFKAVAVNIEVTMDVYDSNSVKKLIDFYQENEEALESARKEIKIKSESGELEYPQMKILDMAFWKIGFKLLEK